MPQDTLMPEDPCYVGLRLEWEQVSLPEGPAWNCTVRRKERGEAWKTVHVSRWTGVMMDLSTTMSTDVVQAFLYDEPRGLAKACAVVTKLARAHQRRYDRVR